MIITTHQKSLSLYRINDNRNASKVAVFIRINDNHYEFMLVNSFAAVKTIAAVNFPASKFAAENFAARKFRHVKITLERRILAAPIFCKLNFFP